MIRPLKILLSALAFVLLAGGVWTYVSYRAISTINIPSYKVIETNKSYEIREYSPYVLLETAVEGDFEESIKKGKQVLDQHIEGKFPLSEVVIGEKGTTHLIAYILPSAISNFPTTTIRIHNISAHKAAVITLRGNPSPAQIEREKWNLMRRVRVNDVLNMSEPVYIQYTPTFVIPFLGRHEVQVAI